MAGTSSSISEEEFQNSLHEVLIHDTGSIEAERNIIIKRLETYLLDFAYDDLRDRIEALLAAPISIDATDERTGMAALHIAVGRNHLELARLLVEHGASFFPDKRGRMPTTIAAECEVSEDLCDFIAEAEARAEGV